ncbi:MAG: site-2 protease family protein [Dehalococcoidia bacterium]|nr:site-2 protease family protein [Dehalococcoidia bacterium]
MGGAFNLGKILDIQFRLHYTWFIIFFLVTISLSWQYFPLYYQGWSTWIYWATGIVASLLFFVSVLAHELAHSLVGRAHGIPIKSITLFIFGGVAQMTREATRAGAELKMAAAGPACSLAIGGLFFLLQILISGINEPVAAMANWLWQINVALAAFNLIPGFPLDGGRVFRSTIWRFTGNYKRSTRIATRLGQGIGYTFILGGIVIIFLRPFGLSWFSGLWLVFIGWFLQNAASISYRQTQWREALRGFTASQVMTSDYMVVPPNVSINYLVQRYILPAGHRFFLVADEGRFHGILTLHNIKSVPQSDWDMTQVERIMTPVDQLKVASPEQDALSILEQMGESDINQIPVVSEGRVIGLITRDNLTRFLRTRSELGM